MSWRAADLATAAAASGLGCRLRRPPFSPGRGRFQPLDGTVEKQVGVGDEPRPARRRRIREDREGDRPAVRSAAGQSSVNVPERAALVRKLVDEIHQDPYQPKYRRDPYGDRVTGWPARLRTYFWPHPVMDLRATAETLAPWFDEAGALSRRLLDGEGWGPEERRRAAVLAWSMLTWGGVTRRRRPPRRR